MIVALLIAAVIAGKPVNIACDADTNNPITPPPGFTVPSVVPTRTLHSKPMNVCKGSVKGFDNSIIS